MKIVKAFLATLSIFSWSYLFGWSVSLEPNPAKWVEFGRVVGSIFAFVVSAVISYFIITNKPNSK